MSTMEDITAAEADLRELLADTISNPLAARLQSAIDALAGDIKRSTDDAKTAIVRKVGEAHTEANKKLDEISDDQQAAQSTMERWPAAIASAVKPGVAPLVDAQQALKAALEAASSKHDHDVGRIVEQIAALAAISERAATAARIETLHAEALEHTRARIDRLQQDQATALGVHDARLMSIEASLASTHAQNRALRGMLVGSLGVSAVTLALLIVQLATHGVLH